MRDTALKASACLALVRVSNGSQEVSGGLTGWALETEVDEVLAGLVSWAKVDAATLVEKDDLVKEVVNVLRLVELANREQVLLGKEKVGT